MRQTRPFWLAFLILNWAIIFFYWQQGSGGLLVQGGAGLLIALGRLAGLSSAYGILQQFFFMGRLPWLERAFGLDKLARLHHVNGQLGLLLLVLHPILLTAGYAAASGTSWTVQLADFLFNYPLVIWAVTGLALFVSVVGVSLYIVRSRLRYESWYFVHLLAYLAIFSSLWHQFAVGTDLLASRLFYGYWVSLYILVFGSHLIFRFLRPLYLFHRHAFRVARVERESPAAVSVYLQGRSLDRFAIRPGQFMIVRFLAAGLLWQAHPFSLSQPPDGRELRITVKELGDFTGHVKNVPPGTKVLIDGPYGIFTDLFGVAQKKLFIAGGIGITPIRSILEEALRRGGDAKLLYANRTADEIVFKKELAVLAANYPVQVTHVLSEEPNYKGEQGYVDEEKIKRLVPDAAARDIYLCGPPPMMSAITKILQQLGVPRRQIHFEKFSLQ